MYEMQQKRGLCGMMFLNSKAPYDVYKEVIRDAYFIDKSLLLDELILAFGKMNRYYCITRPRRFGKTVMANMAPIGVKWQMY